MSCTMTDDGKERCPYCGSMRLVGIGCAFDGINMNQSYRCSDCGEEWEGEHYVMYDERDEGSD